ncbi:MAG: GyrI-like domain-containing protein [Chitinophagaceae bacterium]|nr:GyrI-like domain-containing protein [Chitinophagaceae bacterium]
MFRKRKFLLTAVILLLTAFIFYSGFVVRSYSYQVTVPYPMLKTGEQFNTPKRVVRWYLPFATDDTAKRNVLDKNSKYITAGEYALEITEPSTISAVLRSAFRNTTKEFLFTAASDPADMSSCTVTMNWRSTLFSRWTDKGGLEEKAKLSLENLKTFMEDTRQFYGYEIERTTVADTSFLFLSVTVPTAEKRKATKDLFDRLIAYAQEKGAGYTSTRIFYSTPYGKDQLMLFASIGITNRVQTAPGEPFQYKKMPLGKNLLTATYQGPYGEVAKAYTALENFKTDHKLTSMAIPYQQFLSDGYDFAEDQVVQMKVYYPVF